MSGADTPVARPAQIAAGLERVRARIAAAARAASRDPDEIGLLVVTKFFPASDVRILATLGVRDVGENRHPEARDKAVECGDSDLRWHFIGAIQSNKAAAIGAYADVVESLDRPKLIAGLGRGRHERDPEARLGPLECLVQVSLDPPAEAARRGGCPPEQVLELCAAVAAEDRLRLGGLMAVAPLGEDPARAFARLAEIAELVRAEHPDARVVSAGMSGDLEAAIAAGATHVRVGSGVLGARPGVQ